MCESERVRATHMRRNLNMLDSNYDEFKNKICPNTNAFDTNSAEKKKEWKSQAHDMKNREESNEQKNCPMTNEINSGLFVFHFNWSGQSLGARKKNVRAHT